MPVTFFNNSINESIHQQQINRINQIPDELPHLALRKY